MEKLIALIGGQEIEHGLLYKISNSVTESHTKNMDSEAKAKFEKSQKDDSRLVTARFILKDKHEVWNDIGHCNGPTDPLCMFRFLDGYTYKIPMGLVKKVNEEGRKKTRAGLMNKTGQVSTSEGVEVIREFVPVGFAA